MDKLWLCAILVFFLKLAWINDVLALGPISFSVHENHLNKKMEGHLLAKPNVTGYGNCAYECLVTPDCWSLNYWATRGTCELNSADSITAADSLVPADGYVFSDRDVLPPEIAGDCGHVPCPANSRCLPGPQCVELKCPAPPVVTRADSSYTHVTYGSEVAYTCWPEFYMSGHPAVTCLASLTWSAVEFECKPMCPLPPEVENAFSTFPDRTPGSVAEYQPTDADGHFIDGDPTILCQSNSQWTALQFTCRPLCGTPPAVPNADSVVGDRTPGSEAFYVSQYPETHYIYGDPSILCLENSTWSEILFECRPPETCAELKQCNPSYTADGEYWLYPTYYPGQRVRLYCADMATQSPQDYLTLFNRNEFHYDARKATSYWTYDGDPGCTSYRNEPGSRTTKFNKIRVLPETMTIDRLDFRFVTQQAGHDVPYGYAGDCTHAFTCRPLLGYFYIDTTGTGLVFNTSLVWKMVGWGGKSYFFERSASGEYMYTKCGGQCGGCEPETDMRLEPLLPEPPLASATVHQCV